jgi:hypothetical protein
MCESFQFECRYWITLNELLNCDKRSALTKPKKTITKSTSTTTKSSTSTTRTFTTTDKSRITQSYSTSTANKSTTDSSLISSSATLSLSSRSYESCARTAKDSLRAPNRRSNFSHLVWRKEWVKNVFERPFLQAIAKTIEIVENSYLILV